MKKNIFNRLAGLFLIAMIVLIGTPLFAQIPFGGGTGTVNDPYIINTAAHLEEIRDFDDAYIHYDKHFEQRADIDLGGIVNWVPIGNETDRFTGSYNGNGYDIENMTINRPNDDYVGLFGYIEEAELSGIRLVNVSISGNDKVGGLCGYSDNSTIEKCSVIDGQIVANNLVGGLVGKNTDGSTISFCYTIVSTTGYEYVGGLVGSNDFGNIDNCYARGSTIGTNWVAGLAGSNNQGEIDHCYAAGSVSANLHSSVGGIVPIEYVIEGGGNRNSVNNSYWDTETTGQTDSDGGYPRTTQEMTYPYDQNTYNSLDFFSAWSHDENHTYNSGYPIIGLFAGGDGTEQRPYLIATPSHLNNVRHFLDAHVLQIADIDLGVEPYNDGEGWEPIGSLNDPFTSNFDGDEHTIYNLMINRLSNYQGLFACINNAEISNINLTNIDITASSYTGGLSGRTYNSTVSDVLVSGNITGDRQQQQHLGVNYIGGLIGFNDVTSITRCTANQITIDIAENTPGHLVGGLIGCSNQSDIIGCTSSGNVSGDFGVGGLIGVSSEQYIENSHFFGTVNGNGSEIGGLIGTAYRGTIYICSSKGEINAAVTTSYIGGLIGYAYHGTISESHSESNVTVAEVQAQRGSNIGGLIGYLYSGSVTYCYYNGSVDVYAENVGGLVGQVEDGTISGSYSNAQGVIGNGQRVGGLIGYVNTGTVTESYSDTAIRSNRKYVGGLIGYSIDATVSKSFSRGTVSGRTYLGGFIGYADGGEISESYSAVNTGFYDNDNPSFMGGFIGKLIDGDVYDSYSSGSVSSIYQGNQIIGGLIGEMENGEVNRCYATTTIDTEDGDNIGGLIGNIEENPTIENSYWNRDIFRDDNGIGTGIHVTKGMLLEDSFTNWDFNTTWEIFEFNPYIRKHYPILQWQLDEPSDNWLENNKIDNAHVKMFRNRHTHWESFPRLAQQNNEQYTQNTLLSQVLNQFNGIDKVFDLGGYMQYTYPGGPWTGHPNLVDFDDFWGYEFEFLDQQAPEDYFMYVSGNKLPDNETREIDTNPFVYYWIGYFLHETQLLQDAIPVDILDVLVEIKSQNGGLYRVWCPINGWTDSWIGIMEDNDYDNLYTFYGKMYKFKFMDNAGEVEFGWSMPHRSLGNIDFSRPQPQYFSFRDRLNYQEFFFEWIEDDTELKEIGVFAGDECVGASVFKGRYPLRLLAYTDARHAAEEFHFVLYRGERREPERVSVVEALDNQTGQYSGRVLRPLQQNYTMVRIGERTRGESELTVEEDGVHLVLTLGQNYPNPFSMRIGTDSQTRISLAVPRDMPVHLSVYNIKGQLVRSLLSGEVNQGNHTVGWDGKDNNNNTVSSGIYFYRLETAEKIITRKMLIVR